MSFRKYICFKIVAGLIIASGLFHLTAARAQSVPDSVVTDSVSAAAQGNAAAVASDTTGVNQDTVLTTAAGDSVAPPGTPTQAGTPAAAAAEEGTQIDPQVYINFIYYVLLFLLICIMVAVVGKILQVYELTSVMQGRRKGLDRNKVQAYLFLTLLFVGMYGVYWSYVNHGAMSWKDAATEHGARIDVMFIVTTVITTIVLVLTHIALFWFSFKYRMRPKHKAYFYPHNNTLEKIWTIIPATVLTILVLFGFFTWRNITNVPQEMQDSALKIEVMGEQFTWTVRYAGRDNKIGKRNYRLTTPLNNVGIDFTDKSAWDDILGSEIVIPVNKPVRFHIISKDILHSFYIPDFRVQINAVPGMTNYFQFTPTITTQEMRDKLDDQNYDYVMLCAKICGGGHYNMQKKVRVVSQKEYDEWLAQQTYFYNDGMKKEFASREQQTEVEGQALALNN